MKKYLLLLPLVICAVATTQGHAQHYHVDHYDNYCPNHDRFYCPNHVVPAEPVYAVPVREVPMYVADDSGTYVSVSGSANWLQYRKNHNSILKRINPKSKVGYMGAAAVGYRFNSNYRTEAEFAYRRNKISRRSTDYEYGSGSNYGYGSGVKEKGRAIRMSGMANGYYDFKNRSLVTPYIGIGAGYVYSKASTATQGLKLKTESHRFAMQAMVGADYKIAPKTSLGIEYRCFTAVQTALDHSVGLSLKQYF